MHRCHGLFSTSSFLALPEEARQNRREERMEARGPRLPVAAQIRHRWQDPKSPKAATKRRRARRKHLLSALFLTSALFFSLSRLYFTSISCGSCKSFVLKKRMRGMGRGLEAPIWAKRCLQRSNNLRFQRSDLVESDGSEWDWGFCRIVAVGGERGD